MPRFDLPHPSLEIVGALEIEDDALGGVRPRRLSRSVCAQTSDPALELMSLMTSGVRLRFATTSTSVTLRVHTLLLEVRSDVPAWPVPQVSVLVDGEHLRDVEVTDSDVLVVDAESNVVDLRGGQDVDLVVDGLASGLKQVEVWLPASTTCVLRSVTADDVAAPAPDPRPAWWHYGSSISHGFEAVTPLGTWPAVAAAEADLNLTNLAVAGQAMLDPGVARALAASAADRISLCLGINVHNGASMTLRTFEPALHQFLDVIRNARADVPIHVISPIPFPSGEDVPGPSAIRGDRVVATGDPGTVRSGALTVAAIRDTVERVVTARSTEDPHLAYVDGRDLLRPDETHHLVDGIHPDAAGLELIGHRFGALLSDVDGGAR